VTLSKVFESEQVIRQLRSRTVSSRSGINLAATPLTSMKTNVKESPRQKGNGLLPFFLLLLTKSGVFKWYRKSHAGKLTRDVDYFISPIPFYLNATSFMIITAVGVHAITDIKKILLSLQLENVSESRDSCS